MKPTSKGHRQTPTKHVKEVSSTTARPFSSGYTFFALTATYLLGLLIYSNTFENSFHLDDNPGILMNNTIRDLSDVQAIWDSNHNRFFANLSLAVNYRIGGYDVYGYHVFNLIVHLINATLIYFLSRLLFSTPALKSSSLANQRQSFALFMALIFVSHPLATGSVTYIIQRLASMVTLFYLLSVVCFISGRLSDKKLRRIIWFSATLFAALAAAHTKENAFTIPFALLLTEIFFFQENTFFSRLSFKFWIIGILGAVAVVVVALLTFSTSIFKTVQPELGNTYTLTPLTYLMTQFSVIVKYIQLLFLPVGLNLDYDWTIAQQLLEPQTISSLLILVSILGLAVYLFNRNRLVSFGIFWFFLTLTIESSIVPITDVIFEHRTYLPSFGFFLILTFLVYHFIGQRSSFMRYTILVAIVLTYSSLTYARNKVWKSDETLWLDVVEKSPGKARPKVNLGKYYIDRQDAQKAYPLFLAAEKINGSYFDAVQNSAVCEVALGKYDEAIVHVQKAIKLDSVNVRAYFTGGLAYQGIEDWSAAIRYYSKAIEIDTLYSRAYARRGFAYGLLKNWEAAINDYDKACALDPANSQYFYERGNIYGINKNYVKAIENYTEAIAIDPNIADGYFYRAVSYENLEQWGKAVSDYSSVLRINPNNSVAKANKERIEAFFKTKNIPIPE